MLRRHWGGLLAAVLLPLSVWAADLVLPRIFAPRDPIRAADINANFAALRDEVNALKRASGGGVDGGSGGVRVSGVVPGSQELVQNYNKLISLTCTVDTSSAGGPQTARLPVAVLPDGQLANYGSGSGFLVTNCLAVFAP